MAPLLISLLFILNYFSSTIAAPGSACSSSIYKQLPGLSAYARAESHCCAHSPLPTSNVTPTASAGSSTRSDIFGRATVRCLPPSSVYESSANIPDNYNMIFSRTGITEDPNRPGNVKDVVNYPQSRHTIPTPTPNAKPSKPTPTSLQTILASSTSPSSCTTSSPALSGSVSRTWSHTRARLSSLSRIQTSDRAMDIRFGVSFGVSFGVIRPATCRPILY